MKTRVGREIAPGGWGFQRRPGGEEIAPAGGRRDRAGGGGEIAPPRVGGVVSNDGRGEKRSRRQRGRRDRAVGGGEIAPPGGGGVPATTGGKKRSHRLGTNRLAFLRILIFLLLQFFWISLISGNRFHLFGIYRIFVSIMGSLKIGSRVVVFGSGDSL